MDNNTFWRELQNLTVLYAKTKVYILRAEQVDPELRSNISVFKEQRDGLDHIMRAISEHLGKPGGGDDQYIMQQIENAEGHIFRAAFDALDGTGISYKFRISAATAGIPPEAITAVYPQYYQCVTEMNDIDQNIVAHRNAKDERRTSIAELDDYCASIERLHQLSQDIVAQVPNFQDWKRRQRRSNLLKLMALPLIVGLILGASNFAGQAYWRHVDKVEKANALASPSPSPR